MVENKKAAKNVGKPRSSRHSGKESDPLPGQRRKGIKLRKITIENFKVLEELKLEFPAPRMKDDPDIFVMGSINGLGKTSVLEAISLLLIGAAFGKEEFMDMFRFPARSQGINFPELMIRAGSSSSAIEGDFHFEGSKSQSDLFGDHTNFIKMQFNRNGRAEMKGDTSSFKKIFPKLDMMRKAPPDLIAEEFLYALIGLDSNPLLVPPLLYFHSYRKVQEGNPELGMMIEPDTLYPKRYFRRKDIAISAFKIAILRSLMSKGGLFENIEDKESGLILDTLNNLVKKFAGGSIEKLRPSPDNTLEFRITPGNGGKSYPFDGLSSGQKEIISTLFLVWQNTHATPGIVLIDEPELHMNVQWQLGFIRTLHELAPDNQYIIATHSEDIFESVDQGRRILLTPSKLKGGA